MNADFPRILTLLRKERGISQKMAAGDLGISQALLSHYEKGIRECGLDFVIRCADYYHVSCDYLLGRSPDRNGAKLSVEDIPDPDAMGKENQIKGSILPTLNKKLLANSLNILFDMVSLTKNKTVVSEVSTYLMLAVYKMFRCLYSANPRNQAGLFTVPKSMARDVADAAMKTCEAKLQACVENDAVGDVMPLESVEPLSLTTEEISRRYPMFASSLLNLIQNSEHRIQGDKK
ncbi:helix-turn-helix domain-containing protein [Zongyangia hominis]|uniref:Helix-turn-helix transcriptional regulator n=1 Tax=Zongyangia hominis TaxID=2763677 RepID=A0A926EC13_9FIRM|nr:helix-turn-helix transcriptional regulator [Zongyangia hominis]